MEPDQAAVRAARINDARSASRALSAKNDVAFDCVHPLDECVERLAALARVGEPAEIVRGSEAWNVPMAPQDPWLTGYARRDGVQLGKRHARFTGSWQQDERGRLRLVGHTERSSVAIAYLVAMSVPFGLFALFAWGYRGSWTQGPGPLILGVFGIVLFVVFPLVVMYLGSARVASELELVRTIGAAIGDPETYASRWRRWREE